VQLPNYDAIANVPKESKIAELREAQAMALSVPNTAMAVTIETNSNTDLHPKEKKPIGIRVSLSVQKLIYAKKYRCWACLQEQRSKWQ
jgi:sialate O-acetylesterase